MIGDDFAEDVVLVKQNGKIAHFRAVVDPTKIIPICDDLEFERGDKVRRKLPNRETEVYCIDDIEFPPNPMGEFPPCELTVTRTKLRKEDND